MIGDILGTHPRVEKADGIIFGLLAVMRERTTVLADMGCVPLVYPLVEALSRGVSQLSHSGGHPTVALVEDAERLSFLLFGIHANSQLDRDLVQLFVRSP